MQTQGAAWEAFRFCLLRGFSCGCIVHGMRACILASHIAVFALLVVLMPSAALAQDTALTNAEVVKLVSLNLGDDAVVAKVKQAPTIAFKLETNDLAELKSAGVSGRVIAAMLDRAAQDRTRSKAASVATDTPGGVPTLHGKDGEKELDWHTGSAQTTGFGPFTNVFEVVPGASAAIRTNDHRPTLTIANDVAPQGNLFIVKFDASSKHNDRSIKIGSVLKGGNPFSSRNERNPDPDWCVTYDAVEDPKGTWHLTPKADLKPGEYALYVNRIQIWDFGVD